MLSYEAIQSFVFQEARALDERRWADWLEFYAEDVEYWMPSWDDDDTLTNNPQNEVSLIYYANRQGLEDRIFRIETERSSATIPDTRHSHSITIPVWSLADISTAAPAPIITRTELMNPPAQEKEVEMITGENAAEIADKLADKILAEKVL